MPWRVLAAATVLALGCRKPQADGLANDTVGVRSVADSANPKQASAAIHAAMQSRAAEVLDALAAHDMIRLAALVDPREGVRFSPYAHVSASDVVLDREQVARLWSDTTRRVWGTADGSGEPLRLSFPEYYRRFVFNADFRRAPRVAHDSLPIGTGNTPNNIREAFPGAHVVEYHFSGFDAKYGGMDWSSLWVVLRHGTTGWYLVGLVHGSWTI